MLYFYCRVVFKTVKTWYVARPNVKLRDGRSGVIIKTEVVIA